MMSRRDFRRTSGRSAFTLMEMMVVVAIIVALAGIGIFFLAPQADEGNKTRVKADIKNITQAALTFKTQHAGRWPSGLQELLARDENGYGPYVKNEEDLKDPWGNFYNYDPNGTNNNTLQPDVWCDTPFGRMGNWTSKIIQAQ